MASGATFTVEQSAVYTPSCYDPTSTAPPLVQTNQEPFVASITPMLFSVASCTTLAYVLFVLLFATVSRRPWLQKCAAGLVSVSLTIAMAAMADTMKQQYVAGIQDAIQLRGVIHGGTSVLVVRILSQALLWMAQVQTTIRLFPRHREKLVIKWTGAVLIVLDLIFAILQNAIHSDDSGKFLAAIPILAYLFKFMLSAMYAGCVLYFSFVKRRCAYAWRNLIICVLALASIFVPIVFFVVDIALLYMAGWGDFVRWVASAAASVIVWEWVDRIEIMETEVGKDGILGRQVFEDEMQENASSRSRFGKKVADGGEAVESTEDTMSSDAGGGSSGGGSNIGGDLGFAAMSQTSSRTGASPPTSNSAPRAASVEVRRAPKPHYIHPLKRATSMSRSPLDTGTSRSTSTLFNSLPSGPPAPHAVRSPTISLQGNASRISSSSGRISPIAPQRQPSRSSTTPDGSRAFASRSTIEPVIEAHHAPIGDSADISETHAPPNFPHIGFQVGDYWDDKR